MITAEDLAKLDPKKAGLFSFRFVSGKYVLTNDHGGHLQVEEAEFRQLIRGEVPAGTSLHDELQERGFLRVWLDFDALSRQWRERYWFLWQATSLHIVVVTLRCNQKCVYCQVSSVGMDRVETDMTLETTEKVVDRIFESPNRELMVEFQGGEPLVNWPVVRLIVEKVRRLEKSMDKKVTIGIVSNLSLMDQEKLDFLIGHKVTFCTSLDGPAEIHEKNRLWVGGNSHADTVKWWKTIQERTSRKKYRIDGLTTVTRLSLAHPKEIVDEFVGLGARAVYLRFLSPLGYATRTWEQIGYSAAEFLAFYKAALDHIIEINLRRKDARFFENTARHFLTKILLNRDPNTCDLRNPCGEGIGQLAYDFDGSVYTSDEGRMLARMGDDSFKIGHVASGSHRESMRQPVVRALVMASVLDSHPFYSTHAYKAYDGISPVINHASQGDMFGRMDTNLRCLVHTGILDYLFEKLRDKKVSNVFQRWIAEPGISAPAGL